MNWKEIIVIKDATAPTISILNLMSGDTFNNTAPEFALAITDVHLNSTWYSVNGSDIAYFTGTSGLIDQVLWGSLPNGSVSIQFFALDELGNLGTVEVIVTKFVESKSSLPVEETDDPTIPGITVILIVLQIVVSLVPLAIHAKTRKKTHT